MTRGALLATKGLTRRFGDVVAVDGLDLTLHPGEIMALLGPNGSGKTTTLRMLLGQLEPDAGRALIAGLDCFRQRRDCMRITGSLADEPRYHDHLSGRELIRFVGALHGLGQSTIAQRAEHWAGRLELQDDLDEFVMNYSLGMRKKIGLILALLPEPRLLLLDEPSSGLDPYATRTLQEILRAFAAAGGAVLYSTHLLDQAQRLCDRISLIAHGRLAACGSLADLRAQAGSDSDLEELFFRLADGDPRADAADTGHGTTPA